VRTYRPHDGVSSRGDLVWHACRALRVHLASPACSVRGRERQAAWASRRHFKMYFLISYQEIFMWPVAADFLNMRYVFLYREMPFV